MTKIKFYITIIGLNFNTAMSTVNHYLILIDYLSVPPQVHRYRVKNKKLVRVYTLLGPLTYGGERQRGPIKAVDVLPGQRRIPGALQVVHPIVRAEPDHVAYGEVQTRVPVDKYEYGEHHLADAEHVRVTGLGLGPVEELQHPRHPEQPVGPDEHRARELVRRTASGRPPQVRQVGGQQTQEVRFPFGRAEVVLSQLVRVADHETLVQEP